MNRPSFIALANVLVVLTAVALGGKLLQRYEIAGQKNALSRSSAAYLKLSQYQQVDWHIWSLATLEKARKENKPLFIDAGVYWSRPAQLVSDAVYKDGEIVRYLNEHFVCIRVDADYDPELVRCVVMQVRGLRGPSDWPFLAAATPDGKLFSVTTYNPEHTRDAFFTFLQDARTLWEVGRDEATRKANENVDAVANTLHSSESAPAQPEAKYVDAVEQGLLQRFDARNGGFLNGGQTTKKVEAPALLLLLDRYEETKNTDIKAILKKTLDGMRDSGLNDPVNGGFHMESLSEDWSEPRWPKLMAINGQMLVVYSRAWKLLGDESYAEVAQSIGDHLAHHFLSEDGTAFYTSRSGSRRADEPGAGYLWSVSQVRSACTPDQLTAITTRFGLAGRSGVAWDRGLHVLRVAAGWDQVGRQMGISAQDAKDLALDGLDRMQRARQDQRPPIDLVTYTDVNGLGAYSMAVAAMITESRDYAEIARRVADRLMGLKPTLGGLPHGVDTPKGYLLDQAWVGRAALAMYKASRDPAYLSFARKSIQGLEAHYEDRHGSWGLWDAPEYRHRDDADRAARAMGKSVSRPFFENGLFAGKPVEDDVAPSANAVAAMLGLDLYEATREKWALEFSRRILYAFAGSLAEGDQTRIGLATALNRYLKLVGK